MAAETRRKAPRKRKARRKRRRQRRPADRTRLWALVVLAVIIVSGIVTTIAFDDRHWHAFDDAGKGWVFPCGIGFFGDGHHVLVRHQEDRLE